MPSLNLQGQVPDPEPGCDANAVDAANAQWQAVVSDKQVLEQPIIVNMNEILSFGKFPHRLAKVSLVKLKVLNVSEQNLPGN